MKVCFYFTEFDKDVSSGTSHAMSQWNELFMAFNVKEVFIINETEEKIVGFSENIKIKEYKDLNSFIKENKNLVFIEQNNSVFSHREYKYKKQDCYVFGSWKDLPMGDIYIETNGVALYAREAAAIILSEASWQLH